MTKKEIERRTNKNYELRAKETEEGKQIITATIPYNSRSEDMGFIEILKPGCFKKTINDGYNVRALYQHNESVILGAVRNNTLILKDSPTALEAEITLPDTSEARNVFNLVKDGYITNCSFGFSAIKDDWQANQKGKQERTIVEAKLYEISPVTFPAYEMTSVTASLRGLSDFSIDVEALNEALEERDKEKIKAILEPLYNEDSSNASEEAVVEEPAVEDTGVNTSLYEAELESLLL